MLQGVPWFGKQLDMNCDDMVTIYEAHLAETSPAMMKPCGLQVLSHFNVNAAPEVQIYTVVGCTNYAVLAGGHQPRTRALTSQLA